MCIQSLIMDATCSRCPRYATVRCTGCGGLMCSHHKVCSECDCDESETMWERKWKKRPRQGRREKTRDSGQNMSAARLFLSVFRSKNAIAK